VTKSHHLTTSLLGMCMMCQRTRRLTGLLMRFLPSFERPLAVCTARQQLHLQRCCVLIKLMSVCKGRCPAGLPHPTPSWGLQSTKQQDAARGTISQSSIMHTRMYCFTASHWPMIDAFDSEWELTWRNDCGHGAAKQNQLEASTSSLDMSRQFSCIQYLQAWKLGAPACSWLHV